METEDGAKIFISVTVLLAVAAITCNVLLLSVIYAAEKITKNVANLIFLCIPHLELAILVLVHRSIEYRRMMTSGNMDRPLNTTNTTDSTESLCSRVVVIECLEKGAVLWSIISITSITANQYLHIEKPFWYETRVTTKVLVIFSISAGIFSHLIGLVPMMQPADWLKTCDIENALERACYIIFAAIVIGLLLVIISLSSRMMAIAERHRRKIKEFSSTKTSRADSMKFLVGLILTYFVSNIIPVVGELVSEYNKNLNIPNMKLNVLHLVGPIVYAILYGTRTPDGFIRSIKMAICCCLPVKPLEKEVQIEDVVRLTMMRLGNVMVKIDETAAFKRHDSFLRTKTQFIKSMPFLKPAENTHKSVRRYNSLEPTSKLDKEAQTFKEKASKAVSLDPDALEGGAHPKLRRMFSWLPTYGSTGKQSFNVAESAEHGDSNTSCKPSPVVLTAVSVPRKLSLIPERSESIERKPLKRKDSRIRSETKQTYPDQDSVDSQNEALVQRESGGSVSSDSSM